MAGCWPRAPAAVPRYMDRAASAELLDRAGRMAAGCARYGVPLAAAALQLSVREPRITSTIVGFDRPERVAETLGLATLAIPDALWQELGAAWSASPG